MSSKPETKQDTKQPERKQTDFSKLDTVTLSFNRPAKWYMYVVKQVLKTRDSCDIRARPLGAAQVVRVAEALKRLGYITYEKYFTSTVIDNERLQRFITVKVKKTKDFQKLFDQREAERAKMLESKEKKDQFNKKVNKQKEIEALKRLGYITYEKYYTSTVIDKERLQRFITVKVKKTKDFQKLFDQREAERAKMLESKEKKEDKI